jgi:hypothetical protein
LLKNRMGLNVEEVLLAFPKCLGFGQMT